MDAFEFQSLVKKMIEAGDSRKILRPIKTWTDTMEEIKNHKENLLNEIRETAQDRNNGNSGYKAKP